MKTYLFISLLLYSTLLIDANLGRQGPSHEPSTCLPMNEDNIEVLSMAITDPELEVIWTRTNIHGVTLDSVFYVTKDDPNCKSLLSKYDFWINEKYQNSNVNKHMITFHKFRSNYFVIMQYNNKQEYITIGSAALYILDENLEVIEGFGF